MTTDELYEFFVLVAKGNADRLSEVAAEVRRRLEIYEWECKEETV